MTKIENALYDQFPWPLVLCCVSVNFLIYIVGALLVAPLGRFFVILYLLYCIGLETRVIMLSCRDCFYYGKLCAFGKGKLCALLFKKGNPDRFTAKKISWITLLPDFLVSLIPLAIGAFNLFRSFTWLNLSLIIVMLVLAFPITGYVRSAIACMHCRQRETGCSAIEFFSKKNQDV